MAASNIFQGNNVVAFGSSTSQRGNLYTGSIGTQKRETMITGWPRTGRGVNPMDHEEFLIQHAQKIADEAVKEAQFTRQSVRDMEERMDRRYDASLKDTRESEARIEKRIDSLLDNVRERDERTEQRHLEGLAELRETKRWIIGVCIATLIGIGAIVVSVFLK